MKNLFLLCFLLYVITGTRAFAEKAMAPFLIAPSNFAKNISKDSIKFTWQNSQNEVNAKVNRYRIIISENAQFNGYTPSTGKCNITCVTSVINSATFSTGLRSSNKTYYWRVQGLSPTENGEWSRTGTFKTDDGAPIITSASATPSSTSLGNAINFSATLSSALPNNYNVKLNYGTSTVNMTGSGTNYSVVQTPTLLGQQVFTVGVYDANNNLKGNTFTSNFEIVKVNSVPTLSFISGNTTATAGTSYSVQLQASDSDNNLKSITVVWGDGTTDTQNAINGTTVTFTHTYATANTYNWSATALDSGNASSTAIAKSVTVSAAVVTPPASTSGYSKISNSGAKLPDTAVLGSGPNDWACTKDNKTGLIWEVKTDDGGLRDKDWYYSWYKPSGDNGGFAGYTDTTYGAPNCSTKENCNTDAFTNAVNTQGLCGKKDWRMPTKDELMKLVVVVCSDGKYATDGSCNNYSSVTRPTINSMYFPNTRSVFYWSSSSHAVSSSSALVVYFDSGGSNNSLKNNHLFVRLVRDETPPTTTAYTKISNSGLTLPDTAILGSGPNDWACTKDNKTGLIWEVKTDDGGLRDKDWYYSWYKPSGDNGGNAGYTDRTNGPPDCSTKDNCNTDAFTNAVNTQGLCGKQDWRMPTKDELLKLVVCSDGKYKTDGACTNFVSVTQPTINSMYFPNTVSGLYWSSSPYAYGSSLAWVVHFSLGGSNYYGENGGLFVRLVR